MQARDVAYRNHIFLICACAVIVCGEVANQRVDFPGRSAPLNWYDDPTAGNKFSASQSERQLQASATQTVTEARYYFGVRQNGRVDVFLDADLEFSGGIVTGGQLPILSNTGANCLHGNVTAMANGQTVSAEAYKITDAYGDLWMGNFTLPSPVDSNVNVFKCAARLQYTIQGGVCEDYTNGPRKFYFPWSNRWTTLVPNYSFYIQFPDNSLAGTFDFVCLGSVNFTNQLCGSQLTISNQTWVKYNTLVTLHDVFFQWLWPATPSAQTCPTLAVHSGGPVAQCAGAAAPTQAPQNVVPNVKSGDLDAKWLLVAMILASAIAVVLVVLAGCATQSFFEEKKDKDNRQPEVTRDASSGAARQGSRRDDSGGGVGLGAVPSGSQAQDEWGEYPWRQDSGGSFDTGAGGIPVTMTNRMVFHSIMFWAYWFGARRFDIDGDGDFDAMDVKMWMNMAQFERMRFLYDRMKRAPLPDVKYFENLPAPRPSQSKGLGKGRGKGIGKRREQDDDDDDQYGDDDGDGRRRMITKQSRPYFIICQTVFVVFIWFIGALVDGSSYGGLDGLARGSFDLVLTKPNAARCEDYRPQIWRWLFYQYTHGSFLHVFVNSITNFLYGIPLEGLHGTARMILMYNFGVFSGACCALVNGPHTPVVGMSGGCYAMLGMFLADLVINWNERYYAIPTLVAVMVITLLDLLLFAAGNVAMDISHSAHLGGFVGGILIGLLIGKNYKVEMWERVVAISTFAVGATALSFCCIWSWSQWAPKDIWEGVSWCWARKVVTTTGTACLRCDDDQACITKWTQMYAGHLFSMTAAECNKLGWMT